jgi:tRNA(adenine34) deaminase
LSRLDDEMLVRAAIAAAPAGGADLPVGAVVVDADGVELARAGNAARHGDGWRLTGCTLAVTLEPCTMCAGALVQARVERVVFGAWEPKTGAVGSLWDVVRDRRLNHRPEVIGGVLATECAALLDGFVAGQRGE